MTRSQLVLILGLITRYSGSLREGLGTFAQSCDAPYSLDIPMLKYVTNVLFPHVWESGRWKGEKVQGTHEDNIKDGSLFSVSQQGLSALLLAASL